MARSSESGPECGQRGHKLTATAEQEQQRDTLQLKVVQQGLTNTYWDIELQEASLACEPPNTYIHMHTSGEFSDQSASQPVNQPAVA